MEPSTSLDGPAWLTPSSSDGAGDGRRWVETDGRDVIDLVALPTRLRGISDVILQGGVGAPRVQQECEGEEFVVTPGPRTASFLVQKNSRHLPK